MQNLAEVVRFESQLTVPTRNRSHLSDLWIAISCTKSLVAWAAEFERVVTRQATSDGTSGTLEVVAMSERQGWVVARGVDLTMHGSTDIEEMVQSVVARVNLGVVPLPTPESVPSVAVPWTRIAAFLQSGGIVDRQKSASRTGAAIDALTGRSA